MYGIVCAIHFSHFSVVLQGFRKTLYATLLAFLLLLSIYFTSGETYPMPNLKCNLFPRPFSPPVFDHLQYYKQSNTGDGNGLWTRLP